jgi:GNAT superfamily N-acetyltransferase
MFPSEVLALYDREMRQNPSGGDGYRVDRFGSIVRLLGGHDHVILYSRLSASNAAREVQQQTTEFLSRGERVEWKVYSHDQPPELSALLEAAGWRPTPRETLMAYDLSEALPVTVSPLGVEVRRVRDAAGLEDLLAVDRTAFGHDDGVLRRRVAGRLEDPDMGLFVVYRDGSPVSGGRIETEPGKSFAGLWGGGTVPGQRGHGLYRTLLAARAELARERGARYLTVDALDTTSRPILERVGFLPLAGIVGWELTPSP